MIGQLHSTRQTKGLYHLDFPHVYIRRYIFAHYRASNIRKFPCFLQKAFSTPSRESHNVEACSTRCHWFLPLRVRHLHRPQRARRVGDMPLQQLQKVLGVGVHDVRSLRENCASVQPFFFSISVRFRFPSPFAFLQSRVFIVPPATFFSSPFKRGNSFLLLSIVFF